MTVELRYWLTSTFLQQVKSTYRRIHTTTMFSRILNQLIKMLDSSIRESHGASAQKTLENYGKLAYLWVQSNINYLSRQNPAKVRGHLKNSIPLAC
jgi:hypothetical protein